MSDAAICLCDGNKPNGQSLCAIPAHRIAYLESEIVTLKTRADAADSRAQRAETLVKYATAFLLRFGKADQWIQIEERMTGAWFWKQWLQPEHGPFVDLPSALRALAAAGLLPDDVERAIGDE